MDRQTQLIELYKRAKQVFPQESRGYHNHFQPGRWVVDSTAQWRFDICKVCGTEYANRRERGVLYRVHNWWHYCTKRICSDCMRTREAGRLDRLNPPVCYNASAVIESRIRTENKDVQNILGRKRGKTWD